MQFHFIRFLYGPRFAAIGLAASIIATTTAISIQLDVRPAAIAGVSRCALCNPIVPEKVERQRVAMIVKLFRERIREPREAAYVHPHGQVLPSRIRRARMRRIGIASDNL